MADIGITFTLQVQFNIIKKVKNFVRITLREIKELIVKIKPSKKDISFFSYHHKLIVKPIVTRRASG